VDEYFSSFQAGIRQVPHTLLNHLFLSHRAARLFLESVTLKVLLQWVVIRAWFPILSMVLMPCRTPLRDGHNLILSMSRKSSTRLR
jgi:hypothetical protein